MTEQPPFMTVPPFGSGMIPGGGFRAVFLKEGQGEPVTREVVCWAVFQWAGRDGDENWSIMGMVLPPYHAVAQNGLIPMPAEAAEGFVGFIEPSEYNPEIFRLRSWSDLEKALNQAAQHYPPQNQEESDVQAP